MRKYLHLTNIAKRRPQNMAAHLTQQHAVVPKYAVDAHNSIFATQKTMRNKKLTCINKLIPMD